VRRGARRGSPAPERHYAARRRPFGWPQTAAPERQGRPRMPRPRNAPPGAGAAAAARVPP